MGKLTQWPMDSRIDKLAYVNFHAAAHHFMKSCESNCHVQNVVHLKFKNIVVKGYEISVTLAVSAMVSAMYRIFIIIE